MSLDRFTELVEEDEDMDEFQAWGNGEEIEEIAEKQEQEEDGDGEEEDLPFEENVDQTNDILLEFKDQGSEFNDYDLNKCIPDDRDEPVIVITTKNPQNGEDKIDTITAKLERINLYLPELSSFDTLKLQLNEKLSTQQKRSFKELSQLQLKTDQLNSELHSLNSIWFLSQLVNEIRINLDLNEFESVFHSLAKLKEKIKDYHGQASIKMVNDVELSNKYDELYEDSIQKLNQILSKFVNVEESSFQLNKSIQLDQDTQIQLNDLYNDVIVQHNLIGKLSINLTKLISVQVVDKLTSGKYIITTESTDISNSISFKLNNNTENVMLIKDKFASLRETMNFISNAPTHVDLIQYTQPSIKKYILSHIIRQHATEIYKDTNIRDELLLLDEYLTKQCGIRYHSGEGLTIWCQMDELSLMIEEAQYESLFEKIREAVLNYEGFDQLLERDIIVLNGEEKEKQLETNQSSSNLKLSKAPILSGSQGTRYSNQTSKNYKRISVNKINSNGDEFEEEEEDWGVWGEEEKDVIESSPEKTKMTIPKKPKVVNDFSKSVKEVSSKRLSKLIKGDDGDDEEEGGEEWDAWGAEEEPIELDFEEKEENGQEDEERWDAWGAEEKLSDIEDERASSSNKVNQQEITSKQQYKASTLPELICTILSSQVQSASNTDNVHNLILIIKLLLTQSKGLNQWQMHNELRYLSSLSSTAGLIGFSESLQSECQSIVNEQIATLQRTVQRTIIKELRSFSPELIKDQKFVKASLSPLIAGFQTLMTNIHLTLTNLEATYLIDTLMSQWYEYLMTLILTSREEIGEEESHNLSVLLQYILNQAPFPSSIFESMKVFLAARHRLSNITKILTSHLTEIMDWFYDGELFDLSTEEILKLMSLLFVESDVRKKCEREIIAIREDSGF